MVQTTPNARKLPKSVRHFLIAGVGIVTFLAIASVINPVSTIATPETPGNGAATPQPLERLSLGSMHGPIYGFDIATGPYGGRYTITDATGNVLIRDAYADDVYKAIPEIDVRGMIADVEVTE